MLNFAAQIKVTLMETTKPKAKEIVYNEFVKAFRAYKQRKREWQAEMEVKLAKEEEEIRLKRKSLYAEFA